MNAPTMTPAEVLHAAADYIDEHGWTQGSFGEDDGCTCLWGAIIITSPGTAAAGRAEQRLREDVGSLVGWNDKPGRTQAEVTAKLREVAASLDGAA